jgi:hypothetical protein
MRRSTSRPFGGRPIIQKTEAVAANSHSSREAGRTAGRSTSGARDFHAISQIDAGCPAPDARDIS